MRTDGILGVEDRDSKRSAINSNTARNKQKWLSRKEKWLVVLGVILHAVYMLSIFDIYFKTPIVHGMDPVPPRFVAPAKRLVLLVGALHTTCSIKCRNANFSSYSYVFALNCVLINCSGWFKG